MRFDRFEHQADPRRRGVVIAFVVLTLAALIGMTALTIDVGVMVNTRADLQNAADAAAMAGVSAMSTDAMVMVKQGRGGSVGEVLRLAKVRAAETSALNRSFGAKGTILEARDIQVGWLDITSGTSDIVTGGPPAEWNAVKVTVRRSKSGQNGPVTFFFAGIFGQHSIDITATATAVLEDRAAVITPNGDWLWPFTIDKTIHDAQMLNGNDVFAYDPSAESVSNGPDGMREIHMFPGGETPGNFGLLNIGADSASDAELEAQIVNGVTADDWESETGQTELVFTDDAGGPVTYDVPGNPGLKAALFNSIEDRIGSVVAYLLHDEVTGSGANTVYRIVGVRFGRVVGVSLEDSNRKGLYIQPMIYTGSGLTFDTDAPTTDGAIGRIILAR